MVGPCEGVQSQAARGAAALRPERVRGGSRGPASGSKFTEGGHLALGHCRWPDRGPGEVLLGYLGDGSETPSGETTGCGGDLSLATCQR